MKIKNPRRLLIWLAGAVVTGLFVLFATSCVDQLEPTPMPEIGCSGELAPAPSSEAAVPSPRHIA
ncbi:hypothetical protein [Mycobacterium decipiens]|uniref:Uncharacterized protein n=1 Tax=Mycobacterium decipiens TaxID=1430326 RepID=A0A1X2LX87_9MYCO|nr:hypothetical protein [Mycobacterium decipiens]OSC41711.1 hypothetical protein B8W66_07760 [Mycobacterium decipiens]